MLYTHENMDKMHCWYLLMCIYIILNMKVEGGQICMKCSHAAHPDCGEVERCQDYEECYVREYLTHSGRAWFESGCADQHKCKSDPGITSSGFGRRQTESLTVCEKCCNDTAICNAKGLCGDITFQTPGPICFQCPDASKSNDCDLITTCFKHEKCFLQKKQNSFSHRYHWSSGCASEVVCQFLQQFQTDDRLCNYCCDGDLCNSECKYHSVVLTTTDYNYSSLKTSTQEPASLQITIETTTTVNELLPCENRISNDSDRQWVANVTNYSSQYGGSWPATSVIGPPDVYPRYGDLQGAWAPSTFGYQNITVLFEKEMYIQTINLYETYGAGGVYNITVKNQSGDWHTVWKTNNTLQITKSRIFCPSFKKLTFRAREIRIQCHTDNVYYELDAVEISGTY